MNTPSYDIAEILEAYGESSGLGLDYATDLFIGKEPIKPNDCVTIFDTPGFPPYLGLGAETGYEYPSVQIRVRNTTYTGGWAQAEAIKNVLHGMNHTTVNGTLYTVIICSSGPTLLDWDDNGRARFIMNFNAQRQVV
jgi:hypothetical protein